MSGTNEYLLMNADEKLIFVQLAAGEAPTSQRAQALLALDAGATVEAAAEQSGLTSNQVIYWRGRFGTRRLAVFPDDLVAAARQAGIEEPVVEEGVTETDFTAAASKPTSDKKKKKKSDKKKKGKQGSKKKSKKSKKK